MMKLLVSTVLLAAILSFANAGLAGGLGESKPADNDVNELVERLKPDIIKKVCESVEGNCPSTDSEIVVKTYKTQTVAGTNYFIRILLENLLHDVKVTQPINGPEFVNSVQPNRQATDEISYFP